LSLREYVVCTSVCLTTRSGAIKYNHPYYVVVDVFNGPAIPGSVDVGLYIFSERNLLQIVANISIHCVLWPAATPSQASRPFHYKSI